MTFPIHAFRAIANASIRFHLAFLVLFVAVFAIHHTLSLSLHLYPDGLNLPDKRFGYTPDELNAWYDAIGTEGCPIYVRAATLDFIPIMPTYVAFLGSLLIHLSDWSTKSTVSIHMPEQTVYLPVVTVLFDIVETYIQRRGCVIYPERLTDTQIRLGSFGNMGKWIFLVTSILLIVVPGFYAAFSSKDAGESNIRNSAAAVQAAKDTKKSKKRTALGTKEE